MADCFGIIEREFRWLPLDGSSSVCRGGESEWWWNMSYSGSHRRSEGDYSSFEFLICEEQKEPEKKP